MDEIKLDAKSSFDSITDLLKSDDNMIRSLLLEGDITMAIKQRCPGLSDFLLENLRELFSIALESDESLESKMARGVLISLTEMNGISISESDTYHQNFIDEFSKEKITNNVASIFSRVFQTLLKSNNDQILTNLLQIKELIPKMLEKIRYNAVFEAFVDTLNDTSNKISGYYEKNNSTQIIYDEISRTSDQLSQYRLLRVAARLIIVAQPESSLINNMITPECIDLFFNLATNPENPDFLRFGSFSMLNGIWSRRSQIINDNQDDLFINTCQQRLSDVCEYFASPLPFKRSHRMSSMFLVNIIKSMKSELDGYVIEMLRKMIDRFFVEKLNTFCHLSTYNVFITLIHTKNFKFDAIKELELKRRIIEAFKQKDFSSNYWAFLYLFADEIVEREQAGEINDGDPTLNEQWESFIQQYYSSYKELSTKEYGGHVAAFESHINSDDFEDEFADDFDEADPLIYEMEDDEDEI